MIVIHWGAATPYGHLVTETIFENLFSFSEFCNNLEANNYKLISVHKDGILINYKEADPSGVYRDMDRVENNLNEKIDNIKQTLTNLSINLSEKEFKKSEVQEVTKEFYLLFDMLPEHIRKEIKIYIKNK